MKMPKEIGSVILLVTLLSFVDVFIGYYFVINTYLVYKNLILSALILTLLNASNVLSLPLPYIYKRLKSVKVNVIIFSILSFLIIFTLSLDLTPLGLVPLIALYDFLIVAVFRSLGYYARTLLDKYGEFIDYNSIREISFSATSIIALVLVGLFNAYLSKTYLPIIGAPLLVVALLSIKLNDVKMTLSATNPLKVWSQYIKSNRVFKFMETRIYPVIGLAGASSVLFLKLVYVNEGTFPEYISTVLIVSILAQIIGAVIALKWKSETAKKFLLLSLPAILIEYVFPFIRGDIIPISVLTFLQTVLVAYVFVHINSVYQYIVSKDAYINVTITQSVLTQLSIFIGSVLVSVIATLVGITYTYVGVASLMLFIVLFTISSDTTKDIRAGQ
ncbi:hypothetical protein [Stygiolobus caldivivus]|uniref:MFS transporter n=1 Tax=Stygiolobus caldivivus TaxID=2824673 RepID=A0A8D5U5Z4_9CREN|nr:hypothetical protein [Stygiolobus caldivivus]BCU69882.1 hypothetical protein KN1_11790 [Stygiolobus caldivivus]